MAAARRPISASPPASVPIRLATNGPLSLNGVACCWPKKSCMLHPEAVGEDVAVGDDDQVAPGPSVCAMIGAENWPAASGPCAGAGGPVNAEFSTPRMRAAITRGPPEGLKSARILPDPASSHLLDRDRAGLRARGQQRRESMAAPGFLARNPATRR